MLIRELATIGTTRGAWEKHSPLGTEFDVSYCESLFAAKKNYSAKAFLATEQRIPGVENGALQDICSCAGIHPKRKLSTFGSDDLERLYEIFRETLVEMTAAGGRDTERDLYGNFGRYAPCFPEIRMPVLVLFADARLSGKHFWEVPFIIVRFAHY